MLYTEHIIHLVQEEDKSKKACDGGLWTFPKTNSGDKLVLCQLCAKPLWR